MIYKLFYPATARQPLLRVSNPDSTLIDFGINIVKQITTEAGPAILVKGSSDPAEWGNPIYQEFLIDVGQAYGTKRVGIACYHWREQYWVKAVRPDNQAARLYGKGGIVQYILLKVEIG